MKKIFILLEQFLLCCSFLYLGIAFADYTPKWKFYRKIGHSSMKMFGDGIKSIERLVTLESRELHKRLDCILDVPVDLHHNLGKMSISRYTSFK